MQIDDELRLSYYKEIATLSDNHAVLLVQHIESKKLYVKKILKVYNAEVYRLLKETPVKNIPIIYEAIESDGLLTVIEEYITGDTLQDLLDTRGVFSLEDSVAIATKLCDIVSDLHSFYPPLIHRDIKPSNVILSSDGVVKLLDLNAAKLPSTDKSRDTEFIGTVGYAAPEQYGFGQSSIQTDIYGIGTLINVMLTGTLPNDRLASGAIGEIIIKCTQINPTERYSSVCELSKKLNKLVKHNLRIVSPLLGKYAPPGFRGNNILVMIASAFGYYLVFAISLTMNVEGAKNTADLWLNRIIAVLIFLTEILFFGNYLKVKERIGLNRFKNPLLRFFIDGLCGFAIMVFWVAFMLIIESVLGWDVK